jgi:hypothetical protein
MTTDRKLMQMALEALELEATRTPIPETAAAIEALRARLAEPEPEPVAALKWLPAPIKTEWGEGMVNADVEIDRDHTLTLYCEEDQTAKVDAMFSPTRRPLTPVQEAAPELLEALCALVLNIDAGGPSLDAMRDARAAIAKAGGNDERST